MSTTPHQHGTGQQQGEMFEPASWEDRYAGDEQIWSGRPNPQLESRRAA